MSKYKTYIIPRNYIPSVTRSLTPVDTAMVIDIQAIKEMEIELEVVKKDCHRKMEAWLKIGTDKIEELSTAVSDLEAKLEKAKIALAVYAMTNETFPEYGTVARETLLKAEEIARGEL